MTPAHLDEREALAASFLALGPAAPTILPGWDARELMVHLLLRERHSALVPALRMPGPYGARARAVEGELRGADWETLVERLQEGPGRLSPLGAIDRLSGLAEQLIHHEDLRRAQDGWEPRGPGAVSQEDAWRAVRLMAPLTLRVPVRVLLVSPLGGARVGSRTAEASVRVHGEPVDLLLWATGRERVARVRVHGDDAGRRALAAGGRGL